jgi:putative FmdB family regulatory protein
MPTYDYRCKKGHVFELFHSMSDVKPKRCPKCRSLAQRIPGGGAGLLFKGSGFYITDYRSKSYQDKAKQEGSSGAGSGAEKSKPASSGSDKPASSSPAPEKKRSRDS